MPSRSFIAFLCLPSICSLQIQIYFPAVRTLRTHFVANCHLFRSSRSLSARLRIRNIRDSSCLYIIEHLQNKHKSWQTFKKQKINHIHGHLVYKPNIFPSQFPSYYFTCFSCKRKTRNITQMDHGWNGVDCKHSWFKSIFIDFNS